MKKINMYFIGECIIIILLLVIIGLLLRGKDTESINMSDEAVVVETEQELVEETAYPVIQKVVDVVSEKEVGEVNAVTSEEAVSDNNVATISKALEGKEIVVFGDSIWNDARGEDGISEYVQEGTGATVYNCAIGGTTAAVVGEDDSFDTWTSNSFNGMIYVARKLIPAEQILGEDEVVRDIIKQVDFNEMDYVIVAYGLNDFFSDVSIFPIEYYELTNYVGALRNGIDKLKEHYPHLKIIVIPPTYTKMFEGEKTFEIGDYVEAARSVATELNVEFLDMFHVLGNNAETRLKHLGDGVHMSSEGRKIYSDAVIRFLIELESQSAE